MFKIKGKDIFDINILPVAIVVFLTSFGYGTIITLTPDLSKIVGIHNKGLYFTIFTIASLFVRIFGGKISDRKGRVNVLIGGAMILILALITTSITFNKWFFIFGGILYGLAWGVISPSYQAWTVDRSTEFTRGRAIATMYISLEAGIGCGAVLPMFLYQNKSDQIGLAFLSGAFAALLGLIYLLYFRRRVKKQNPGISII